MKMILPIFVTIIGALILSAILTYTYFNPALGNIPEPINPISEPTNDPVGIAGAALGNALIYVGIALVGGLIFVLLLRQGLHRILEIVFASIMGLSAFLFGSLIVPALLYQLIVTFPAFNPVFTALQIRLETYGILAGLVFAIINFAVLGLQRFKTEKLHNALMILFGMSMGSIFGIWFDHISLIVVLIALGLYDIYAVFYGPLKQMFQTLGEDNSNKNQRLEIDQEIDSNLRSVHQAEQTSSVDANGRKRSSSSLDTQEINVRNPNQTQYVLEPQFGDITLPIYTTPFISIGLGDFVFFSVLVAKAVFLAITGGFLFLAPTEGLKIYYLMLILPIIGILIGTYITFRLLEKQEILPALPIPLMLGLVGFFLAVILQI